MKERALKVPEDTHDMTDMIKFIKEAKTSRLVKLNEQIKVSSKRKISASMFCAYNESISAYCKGSRYYKYLSIRLLTYF